MFDLDDEPYTRESFWTTYEGKEIQIKDLDDTHLANLIHHLMVSPYHTPWTRKQEFINTLMNEVELRGLLPQFLERAPIPYKDEKGNWKMWSFEKHEPVCLNTPEKV